jgi:hypothetical protein
LSCETLDKVRAEYEKKIEEDESQLADVLMRLLRNKKILKQAEDRADKKAECLANEMEESGETVRAEDINCPAADALVGFLPAMWSTLDCLNSMSSVGIEPTSAGNS